MKKLLAFILTLVMVASTFTMLPLSVSADTATPELLTYSQDYAGQPAGSGTEADPYKIATADDLLWMSKQVGTGGTSGSNVFKGTYFKQTKDIDLGGNILPTIGYYTGNTKPYRFASNSVVFGGIYDGDGKVIRNGYFAVPKTDGVKADVKADANNNAWGVGLFGVIYNATIKNVNLQNIQYYKASDSHKISVAGAVVGIAIGNSENGSASCNVIENCNVYSSCSFVSSSTNGRGKDSESLLHYRWGGIVGFAMDTTIKNCTNEADISVNGAIGTVGGIVGCMTSGVIEHCVNKGNITISNTDTTASIRGDRAYGGIVGFIPNVADHSDTIAAGVGVEVNSSWNAGNINVTTQGSNTCYYGGIVGAGFLLSSNKYAITNCYNTGAIVGATGTIASILGTSTTTSDGSITVSGKSVDINGNTADVYYNGTANAVDCSTESIEELVKEADMACAADLYVQSHSNGSYRFLATINSADIEDWDKVGFEVTLVNNDGAKSNVKDVEVTKCYTAITANGKPVADTNGRLFIVFVLKGDFSDIKGYEFSAYVTEGDNTYNTRIGTGDFG